MVIPQPSPCSVFKGSLINITHCGHGFTMVWNGSYNNGVNVCSWSWLIYNMAQRSHGFTHGCSRKDSPLSAHPRSSTLCKRPASWGVLKWSSNIRMIILPYFSPYLDTASGILIFAMQDLGGGRQKAPLVSLGSRESEKKKKLLEWESEGSTSLKNLPILIQLKPLLLTALFGVQGGKASHPPLQTAQRREPLARDVSNLLTVQHTNCTASKLCRNSALKEATCFFLSPSASATIVASSAILLRKHTAKIGYSRPSQLNRTPKTKWAKSFL